MRQSSGLFVIAALKRSRRNASQTEQSGVANAETSSDGDANPDGHAESAHQQRKEFQTPAQFVPLFVIPLHIRVPQRRARDRVGDGSGSAR
jgi:hypothetical protein